MQTIQDLSGFLFFPLPAQWLSVLDIIAKALFDNNMEFSQINGIHKFQVRLHCLLLKEVLFHTATVIVHTSNWCSFHISRKI